MHDLQIRAALERHWTASATGDQDAEHEIYHEYAVVEYPQSGERVRGRHNVQALRSQHPARPSGFVVGRIVGGGDLWVTEYVITYDGRRVNTVSIMEFLAGKVVRETQYFAEPFAPRVAGPVGGTDDMSHSERELGQARWRCKCSRTSANTALPLL